MTNNKQSILAMPGTPSVQSTQNTDGYLEYDGNYSNYISVVDGIISNLNSDVANASKDRHIYSAVGGAVRAAKKTYEPAAKANCISVAGKNAVLSAMRDACGNISKKYKRNACKGYVSRKANEFERWRNKGCAGNEGDYDEDTGSGGGLSTSRGENDTSQAGFGGSASPEQTKQILLWGGIVILTAAVIAGGIYGYKAMTKPAAKPKLLTA